MSKNFDYTLDDIKQFLIDYQESKKSYFNEWIIDIPFVGKKMYKRALLERQKVEFFTNAYNTALMGTKEEQMELIRKMTPVLDDFYDVEKTNLNEGNKRIK